MPEGEVDVDRRTLLTKMVPLACLGCMAGARVSLGAEDPARFLEKTGVTAEEMYAFFYSSFIPVLQALANKMGREQCLAVVASAASENTEAMIAAMVKDWPARDIKGMAALWQSLLATPPFDKALAYEIVEQSQSVLELKFTACLPAKLLRAMNATDIGYALECSGSKAVARAFNSRIEVSNPKNLMRGDSYCTERYVLRP